MNVRKFLSSTKKMHFSLMDPDPRKNGVEEAALMAEKLGKMGTDAILIGGSTNVNGEFLDKFVTAIKKRYGGPVILFPGGASGLTSKADALLFMSLLNSKNPFWISEVQSKSAILIKKMGIETIPMAYLIIEPGMKVGEVGEADAIKRNDVERAVGYCMAAEMMGFSLIYLEAGSGAPSPVPEEMVRAVKAKIGIPLIVGGGIRKADDASRLLRAGADIIVTGTVIENDFHKVEKIIRAVKEFK